MIRALSRNRRVKKTVGLVLTLAFTFALLPPPPHAAPRAPSAAQDSPSPLPPLPAGQGYRLTTLISDVPGLAPVLDPLLVNPWGISLTAASPFWVANNGTSTTQLIRDPNGAGPVVLNPSLQTVNIPGGLPTGTVGNTTNDFVIPPPATPTPTPTPAPAQAGATDDAS